VARHFDDHVLSCGLTAYAHPLTCAAIAAALAAYQDEGLIARAERLGRWLGERLKSLGRPFVREVRGVGLLWALELAEPDGTAATPARSKRLAAELRARRLHLHKRDAMIFLAPPLVITEDELAAGVEAVFAALDAVWGT
jgi:taurine--2-oxoglutarate transaminase